MDIQIEKYKLIEWLMNLKDEAIISKIKNIKNGFKCRNSLSSCKVSTHCQKPV